MDDTAELVRKEEANVNQMVANYLKKLESPGSDNDHAIDPALDKNIGDGTVEQEDEEKEMKMSGRGGNRRNMSNVSMNTPKSVIEHLLNFDFENFDDMTGNLKDFLTNCLSSKKVAMRKLKLKVAEAISERVKGDTSEVITPADCLKKIQVAWWRYRRNYGAMVKRRDQNTTTTGNGLFDDIMWMMFDVVGDPNKISEITDFVAPKSPPKTRKRGRKTKNSSLDQTVLMRTVGGGEVMVDLTKVKGIPVPRKRCKADELSLFELVEKCDKKLKMKDDRNLGQEVDENEQVDNDMIGGMTSKEELGGGTRSAKVADNTASNSFPNLIDQTMFDATCVERFNRVRGDFENGYAHSNTIKDAGLIKQETIGNVDPERCMQQSGDSQVADTTLGMAKINISATRLMLRHFIKKGNAPSKKAFDKFNSEFELLKSAMDSVKNLVIEEEGNEDKRDDAEAINQNNAAGENEEEK